MNTVTIVLPIGFITTARERARYEAAIPQPRGPALCGESAMIVGVLYPSGQIQTVDRFGERYTLRSADARVHADRLTGRSSCRVVTDDHGATWGIPRTVCSGNTTTMHVAGAVPREEWVRMLRQSA